MILALKPELGRWEEGSESFFSQGLYTFLSKILAPEEICPGTGKITKMNGDKRKRRIQAGWKYHAVPE